jgi:hypothetical protein
VIRYALEEEAVVAAGIGLREVEEELFRPFYSNTELDMFQKCFVCTLFAWPYLFSINKFR